MWLWPTAATPPNHCLAGLQCCINQPQPHGKLPKVAWISFFGAHSAPAGFSSYKSDLMLLFAIPVTV